MPHYFTNDNTIKKEYETTVEFCGRSFVFATSDGVFSKREIDSGTTLLLESVLAEFDGAGGPLVDLGCGYGVIGVVLSGLFPELDVLMLDINEQAVSLAVRNIERNRVNARAAVSDGFMGGRAGVVITNPPFRAGKETVIRFFRGVYAGLAGGGVFYAVLRKQQGAESYMRHIGEIFGNCMVLRKKKGYIVIKAVKQE